MTARIYSFRTGRECYAPIVAESPARRGYAETPALWPVAVLLLGFAVGFFLTSAAIIATVGPVVLGRMGL